MDDEQKNLTITTDNDHMNKSISSVEEYILPPLGTSGLLPLDTISINNITSSNLNTPNSTFYPNLNYNWNQAGYNITGGLNSAELSVKGNAEFDGDVKIKGHSILHLLKKIEDRLAVLQEPDPERLEKFAALKKAYDHYKTLERLIGED